jgi:dipeptidyl-peptidase-3
MTKGTTQMRTMVPVALLADCLSACSSGSNAPAPAPAASSPAPAAAAADRKYLLETVDDAAVIQLYADGFNSLPLQEKTLIWHLYQAAIAGRDIFIDQKHRNALEMRALIEAVVLRPEGVDPAVLAEVQRYTKLFWINNGAYNNLTAQKFVLQSTPPAFAAAVKTAVKNGAMVTPPAGESLDAMLARLAPMFFDPDVDPIVTAKTPPPGKDILTASANNLYSNVSLPDLKGFTEKYGLNSRLVKQPNGRLVEEVYRVGGRYSKEITEVIRHLEAAIPFAS